MSFMGIDLGTSGVKVVICDEKGEVIASESSPLSVQNLQPLWSEQNPEDWWQAVQTCIEELNKQGLTRQVESIGIAGQMHGAVLLDETGTVLRPAILWNDGRCAEECEELTEKVTDIHKITGNLVMPGFTAPKVLWVAKHEPKVFSKIAKVLLPKDFIRFKLSGEYFSDMSDASGTSWLDIAKRQWSEVCLKACGLGIEHMPTLCEGNQIAGQLNKNLAYRWNMTSVPIAGGGGDNAAGAVGSGVIFDGQTILSLGTSGVLFSACERYLANPEKALHSFCHALPNKWHVMSVHLSAASCLQWFANNTVEGSVEALLNEVSSAEINETSCFFLPYLSGERTPYNNPKMGGEFVGLSNATSRADMTLAVLEGVAFSFKNGLEVMHDAGVFPSEISIIGGGARSEYWRQLIADILEVAIVYREGGEVGPALGGARLAQLAVNSSTDVEAICPSPKVIQTHLPNVGLSDLFNKRFELFKAYSQQANQRTKLELS